MDKEKNNLVGQQNGNKNDDLLDYKTENFMVSAICLVITIFILLMFALFVATNSA